MGLLLLLGGNGVVSWAEQHVASGIAALMVGLDPALDGAARSLCATMALKPDWKIMIGLLIGFGGIVLLVTLHPPDCAPPRA